VFAFLVHVVHHSYDLSCTRYARTQVFILNEGLELALEWSALLVNLPMQIAIHDGIQRSHMLVGLLELFHVERLDLV